MAKLFKLLILVPVAAVILAFSIANRQDVSVSFDPFSGDPSLTSPLYLLLFITLLVGVVIGGPVGDRLLSRKLRSGRLPLLVVAFGGSLAFIVPALASPDVLVTMPLLVVGGVLLGGANPALDATRIDIVPPRLLGRAEAVRTAVRDGADASAPLAFGVLAAGIGLRQTFLFMTLSLVLALVLCVVSLRTYPRDMATVPDRMSLREGPTGDQLVTRAE